LGRASPAFLKTVSGRYIRVYKARGDLYTF